MSRDFVKVEREHVELSIDDIDYIFYKNEVLVNAVMKGPLLAFLVEFNNPHFKWVNDRVVKVLGWSKDEMEAIDFFDLIHPEDKEMSLKAFKTQTMLGRDDWVFKNRYRKKDGNYVTLVWASTNKTFGNYMLNLALPLESLNEFEEEWKQK